MNLRWSRFAEQFFGAIAKSTMVIAAVMMFILGIVSGDACFLTDIPTIRKDWGIFLLILLAIGMSAALAMYFHWLPI